MLQRFLRDSAAYGAATLLTRGIAILLVPIYTRVLAPTDYGVIDIAAALAGIVASVVPLEIVQAVARFYSDPADTRGRRGFASTALWFAVGTYAAFTVGCWMLAEPIGQLILGRADGAQLTRIAVLAISANGLFYVVQSQLRWSLQARLYAASAVVYSIASVASSVTLVVFLREGVTGVFVGQIVGAVVGIAVAGRWARVSFGRTFDRQKLREMLSFSVPLIPSTLGLLLALYVDRLAIAALMTLADVGIFGIGYRVALLTQLIVMGFQTAVTPIIYASHRDPGTPVELARIFRLFAAVSLLLWLGLGLFAPEIVAVATTAQYAGAAAVVPILVPAVLLSGAYVFMPGAAIAKQTGRIASVNIGVGALNTALNLILIPVMQIRGAALATLISAAVGFALNVVVSQRAYPTPHDWRLLGTAVLLIAFLLLVGGTYFGSAFTGICPKLGLLIAGSIAVGLILVKRADLVLLAGRTPA